MRIVLILFLRILRLKKESGRWLMVIVCDERETIKKIRKFDILM